MCQFVQNRTFSIRSSSTVGIISIKYKIKFSVYYARSIMQSYILIMMS